MEVAIYIYNITTKETLVMGYHSKIHKNTLSMPTSPTIKTRRVFIIFRSVVTAPTRFLENYGWYGSTYSV